MTSELSTRRRAALEAMKQVPKVIVSCTTGSVVRLPATMFVGCLFRGAKRAGELLPGDTILLMERGPLDLSSGKGLWHYETDWDIVERIEWPTLDQEPEFTRAGGRVRCDFCNHSYFDHPADRRYPDAWPKPGPGQHPVYSLTLLCDGRTVKL